MKYLSKLLIALIASLYFSCSTEMEDTAVFVAVANENHRINYQGVGNKVRIDVESLKDSTDDTNGEVPNRDQFFIYVDYNRNSALDPGVDLELSKHVDGEGCISTLINQTDIDTCVFNANLIFSSFFNESVIHSVLVLQEDLADDDKQKCEVVFKIVDGSGETTFYPSNAPLFSETIELKY